jgi:hypothetical protein
MQAVTVLSIQKQPKAVVETITPALAEAWLQDMRSNRPVYDAKTIEYAMAMDKGGWVVNGETIKFDEGGQLFDGQHRLRACMLCGKPFQSLVVRGISDPDAFATVDSGKTRTHTDVFSVAGIPSAANCSSAALLIYLHQSGQLRLTGPDRQYHTLNQVVSGKKEKVRVRGSGLLGKTQLLEFAQSIEPGLLEAVRFSQKCPAKRIIPVTSFAACFYLFAEKSREDAIRFFEDLGSGAGLSQTDAVYHLRERLLSTARTHAQLSRWAVLLLVYKAWNKRRRNEQVRTLKIIDGEEFPVIV